MATLQNFERGVKWKNWSVLMESYYLPDHASEAKAKYDNNLERWFLADKFTASILKGNSESPRFMCILALREKHISTHFDPHFVVYYRVQKSGCQDGGMISSDFIDEGQMEWGFDTKMRRWIHLRKLG